MSWLDRKPRDYRRNEETYEIHQEKIALCGLLYGKFYRETGLFTETIIKPMRCGSNYCEKCRMINIYRLRDMFRETLKNHDEVWRFLTLTFDPKKKSIPDQYKDISLMWDRFRKRLNREAGELKWIRSVELQTAGNIHVHSILNKFIDKSKIIKHWTELDGGGITISLNPKCKLHGIKKCSVCYPAQWLHLSECKVHSIKNCFQCFPYLGMCSLHRQNECGICYPSNVFDVQKHAANYLTVELIKSKQHQDPYKTGLNWWKARRRSIAMSRSIQLKRKHDDIKYSFLNIVGDKKEVDYQLKSYALDNSKVITVERDAFVISKTCGYN